MSSKYAMAKGKSLTPYSLVLENMPVLVLNKKELLGTHISKKKKM